MYPNQSNSTYGHEYGIVASSLKPDLTPWDVDQRISIRPILRGTNEVTTPGNDRKIAFIDYATTEKQIVFGKMIWILVSNSHKNYSRVASDIEVVFSITWSGFKH